MLLATRGRISPKRWMERRTQDGKTDSLKSTPEKQNHVRWIMQRLRRLVMATRIY